MFVSRVFRPVIAALNWTANGVFASSGGAEGRSHQHFTLEQVAGIVEQSQREGTLSDTAGTLAGAFEFTDRLVSDEDVPIDDMVLLPPA